jgi:amidase
MIGRAKSIADAINEIASGRVLSAELTHSCLQRIDKLNSRVNAVVTLNHHSLEDAKKIDQSSIRAKHLLGLPFTVKDAFKTAGIRSTSSYRPLSSYVPDANAVSVDMLLRSGGILIGKTNLPELAADPQCRSPLFGVTNNPWDLNRTSGGSSGGSAVAVALGFSWLDLGSDFAGSIRIPASFCGVVGFKATEGRIPSDGHIPPLPGSASRVNHMLSFGLLTRRVGDVSIGLSVLTSRDQEPSTLPCEVHSRRGTQDQQLTFAFWDDFDGLPLCSRTRDTLKKTISNLVRAGHKIDRKRPEGFHFESLWNAFGVIAGAEAGFVSNQMLRSILSKFAAFPSKNQPIVRGLLAGLALRPTAYENALRVRQSAIDKLERFMANYDAWILPASPCVAYQHMHRFELFGLSKIRFEGHSIPYIDGAFGCTSPFSLTGSPVLSLPCSVTDGIPVGLQFVGRRMQDQQLVEVCTLVEEIVGGYRVPPLLSDELLSDFIFK